MSKVIERATAPMAQRAVATRDPIAEVERFHSLKEKGAITAEEFEKMKSRILGITPSASPAAQTSIPNPVGSPVFYPSQKRFCMTCGSPMRMREEENAT